MRKHRLSLLILSIVAILLAIAIFSGQVKLSTTNRYYTKDKNTVATASPFTGNLLISPYGTHEQLIELLSQAKYTIRIRMYQFDDEEIMQLLKNKVYIGVDVQIIIENKIYGDEKGKAYQKLIDEIEGTAIQIKTDEYLGTNFVHAKTFIIDDATYIISTANMTYPSFFMNREYRFVGHDTGTLQVLNALFESDRQAESYTDTLPDYLWICPFNCRTQLMQLLDQATSSIQIQAQYLEDDLIATRLAQKIDQGIDVQLMRGKYQDKERIKMLTGQSRILSEPNIHAKNILIDGKVLYLGSMNLSTNAIENNREIGIVIADPQVIRRFTTQFDRDRTVATPFY